MKKTISKQLIFYVPLLILNIISLFNMINAKLISPVYTNAFIKQLIWFIIGYLLIFIIPKLKLRKIFKYSKYLYLFSCFLLLLVLWIGKDLNGAKCWFSIFGFSFQPSELAKLALGLYLTDIISRQKIKSCQDQIYILIKIIIITLIPSILVFLEPDTGAIINFLIILFIAILYLKLNKWWYISFGSILLLLFITFFSLYYFSPDTLIKLIGTSFFYRMDRLVNFASGTSYQLENALITIGSASFWGVGFNKILLYIPEAPTDFFFAFSIGNFGILSALIILLCLLIIDSYILYNAKHLKNNKYKIFTYMYLGIFLFHQIYNIAMNVGLLPIMGIPLPFLSYGGTSTLINFLFMAMILNFIKAKHSL